MINKVSEDSSCHVFAGTQLSKALARKANWRSSGNLEMLMFQFHQFVQSNLSSFSDTNLRFKRKGSNAVGLTCGTRTL